MRLHRRAVLLVWIGLLLVPGALPLAEQGAAPSYTLRLGEFAFDPASGLPQLPAGWQALQSEAPDLHLIQLDGPTDQASLDEIVGRGAEIVQYVHPYTYIVWGRAAEIQASRQVGSVRAATAFAPAFRVQPQYRNMPATPQPVRVLMYRGADVEQVVGRISEAGGIVAGRRVLDDRFEIATFDLLGDRIRAVSAIPGVYSISVAPTDGGLRGEMSNQVCADNVDGSNLAFPGYESWLSSIGVDGDGVIIANVDGGISQTHPDLTNNMLGCVGDTCGGGASSTHGTHTAGTMAADGASGTTDGFGFLRGQGVAPGAKLVEQVYSPTFTQAGGMLKLMSDSSKNNAFLSGNSWGPAGSPRGYDDDTMQVDIGVRDANAELAGNQELTYVLSFMNGNGGTSSQGTPDEAKNLFNIGSTKMQASNGSQLLDIDDLSSNTAHGPALDGRTIPHMVAPGCRVDSTLTSTGYGLLCGTSMASPHVSGAVALFVEHYRDLPDYTTDPSAALVKAAFLVVARNLAGNRDADGGTLGNPFDSKQGWGRMDLPPVLDPPANSVRYFDNPVVFDSSGEEWVTGVAPLDPDLPMRIMLVWTDAPGHGLGGSTPAWNNDLDLVVEIGANTYRGNNFGGDGFSIPGGSADGINNTEGVFLAFVPGGGATVRVQATNINSDAIPGVGDATDQDFALVCYNCAVEATYTMVADPLSLDVCAPADGVIDIDVGSIAGFSDPVTLSVNGVPAGATATLSDNPVIPPAASTLTIGNTAGAALGSYALRIQSTSGSIDRDADVDLLLETAPGPGRDLTVGPAGLFNLTWSAPAAPGSQTVTYDVLRSNSASDFSGAICRVSGTSFTHATDIQKPLPGNVFHYLIRVRNDCGTTMGTDSAGAARAGGNCP